VAQYGFGCLATVIMAAISRNMMWDGFFHLATWAITLLGVWMLWSVPRVGNDAV